ncbi:hypothetical protein BKA69DRAFT_685854 [Paraphysoderma sedebokerense]|nr:hypothetical protein BKA69DRAFT_685854 [Paraphysoderma sedebokerense]
MKILAIAALFAVAFSGAEATCGPRAVPINRPVAGSYGGVQDCNDARSRQEATAACQAQVRLIGDEHRNEAVVTFDGLTDYNQNDRHWKEGTFKNKRKCSAAWSANCQMCLTRFRD